MKPVQQPAGQVRLTNVAIVRYKRMGKRFEVAAYKNKVMNWRNRIETDVNEVLQTHTVFFNVSKGVVAGRQDLIEAFGTDEHLQCALVILDKGELEVSDKERAMQYNTLFRDVATMIAEKCVNPDTNRPYPISMIERALHDVHFAVLPTKSAKAQALRGIAALKGYMPIERARMKVRVSVPDRPVALPAAPAKGPASGAGDEDGAEESAPGAGAGAGEAASSSSTASAPPGGAGAEAGKPLPAAEALRAWLGSMHAALEYEGVSDGRAVVEAVVDPGFFRRIEEEGKRAFGGADGSLCSVEVLSLAAIADTSAAGGGKGGGGAARAGGDGDSDSDGEGGGGAAAPAASRPLGASAPSGMGAGSAALGGGAMDAATLASAKGTGMAVRRVTQPGRRLACNACGLEFAAPEEHREHHRSDLHRFNLKRKVKGLEPLSADGFDALPAKERDAFLAADV
jgi:ribosome maturation protein SDO1